MSSPQKFNCVQWINKANVIIIIATINKSLKTLKKIGKYLKIIDSH